MVATAPPRANCWIRGVAFPIRERDKPTTSMTTVRFIAQGAEAELESSTCRQTGMSAGLAALQSLSGWRFGQMSATPSVQCMDGFEDQWQLHFVDLDALSDLPQQSDGQLAS